MVLSRGRSDDWAMIHPANKIENVRRRVDRARNAPGVTCPASRHVHMIADALVAGENPYMLQEDPEHCAGSLYAVLESLWKLRAKEKR